MPGRGDFSSLKPSPPLEEYGGPHAVTEMIRSLSLSLYIYIYICMCIYLCIHTHMYITYLKLLAVVFNICETCISPFQTPVNRACRVERHNVILYVYYIYIYICYLHIHIITYILHIIQYNTINIIHCICICT